VQFCAFDILAEGGDDLRKLPLHFRKTNLERLLAARVVPRFRCTFRPDMPSSLTSGMIRPMTFISALAARP
jgi:ATP-dependent DNA ligase